MQMREIADRPWEALPREVAGVLEPELPTLADEIIEAISRGVPDYARPLGGPFGQALRLGVEEALRRFVAMVEGRAGSEAGRDVYVNLGRGEMRAGRSLDALLAAYRLGARVAWRRLAAAGEAAGLEPRTLYLLAEAIFAYIDELSADSIEGYAREQAAAAGEVQRRRRRLAALLVQDPPADRAAVESAAAAASWPLPRTIAAVAVEGEAPDRLAVRLGPDALVAPAAAAGSALVDSAAPAGAFSGDGEASADGAASAALVFGLIPDPLGPGGRAQLEAALRGSRAALGPAVAWPDAGMSFARAVATLRVVPPDGDGGLLLADEHRLEILLGLDRRLADDIAREALRDLDAETQSSRERLTSTLEAWLRHRGRTEEVARALHVHPQTVRYRMWRLRELLGDRLDDPDGRFELELALRARPDGGPGGE
jgi:hypothetical protein